MEFIWFLGGVYALYLIIAAMDSAAHKAPWREFAIHAALGAVMFAALGGLMYLANWWLSQNPWRWLLFIGFIALAFCVWFVVGVTGLLVSLFYRD